MNRKQKNKLTMVICLVVLLSTAAGLVLYALKQNINLFYTPTQLATLKVNPKQALRIGGYVKKQSVHYDATGTNVRFTIMDPANQIEVVFDGVLPTLFREGQGVVVTGKLIDSQHFAANEVLAKHDEKYVPRYLKEEMEKTARQSA
ncbi:MAG: cytochrome c maturation protein CcmE [Pseudomonadota bacterium]